MRSSHWCPAWRPSPSPNTNNHTIRMAVPTPEGLCERELLLLGRGCLVRVSRVLKGSLETTQKDTQDGRNPFNIQIHPGQPLRKTGLSKTGCESPGDLPVN